MRNNLTMRTCELTILFAAFFMGEFTSTSQAQPAPVAPVAPVVPAATSADGLSFDTSLRYRAEIVDWPHPAGKDPNAEYTYHHFKLQLGAKYQAGGFRAYAQGQYFQLVDLPFNGVGPGSVYYSTNGDERNPGDAILRQLHVGYGDKLFSHPYDLSVGRMFYANGSEVPHADKAVEALKKQRIYNRVIGTFDFTAGRSFDSLRAKYELGSAGTMAGGFMRPTQGGFSTEGSIEIQDIDLGTVALSLSPSYLPEKTDAQIFWYYYGDDRQETAKTDNRPIDIRNADVEDIAIHNIGAHWVQLFPGKEYSGQLLLWGVLQSGDWGEQDMLAGALAVETGVQFDELCGKPLFRLGYNYGSGDDDPSDNDHGTFMQMLPTARQYAYTPLYNMMNNQDVFASASVQPKDNISVLSAVHYLYLSSDNDLLYSGGGANLKSGQFGFAGLPLSGSTLGLLPEITVSYDIDPAVNLSLYYGHLFPSDSYERSTGNSNLNYAFVEMTAKY